MDKWMSAAGHDVLNSAWQMNIRPTSLQILRNPFQAERLRGAGCNNGKS